MDEMLHAYIELMPITIVGFICGGVGFLQEAEKEGTTHPHRAAVKSTITSCLICVIVYAILSATSLPYLARVGISAAIAFFGVQKALELIKEILNLKKGNKE